MEGRRRKCYTVTAEGEAALALAKNKIRESVHEVLDGHGPNSIHPLEDGHAK